MAQEMETLTAQIIADNSQVQKELTELARKKEELEKRKADIENRASEVKKRMEKGDRLEDEAADFCFFHFGLKVSDSPEVVREFLSELRKYQNQLILEHRAGYSWTTTKRPGEHAGHEEKRIYLARLVAPIYNITMPDRKVKAIVAKAQAYSPSTGWKELDGSWAHTWGIDDFIIQFIREHKGKTPSKGKEDEKLINKLNKRLRVGITEKLTLSEGARIPRGPEGIYVDIATPYSKLSNPPLTIGGSTKYDSEPHASLIIGDDAVRHYLGSQKLTHKREIIERVEVPNL